MHAYLRRECSVAEARRQDQTVAFPALAVPSDSLECARPGIVFDRRNIDAADDIHPYRLQGSVQGPKKHQRIGLTIKRAEAPPYHRVAKAGQILPELGPIHHRSEEARVGKE